MSDYRDLLDRANSIGLNENIGPITKTKGIQMINYSTAFLSKTFTTTPGGFPTTGPAATGLTGIQKHFAGLNTVIGEQNLPPEVVQAVNYNLMTAYMSAVSGIVGWAGGKNNY